MNKKSYFDKKVKTKSLTILLVTFLLSALASTQLVGEASALIAFTEYDGTLPGGDWMLRIPDPWNGMLVVLCRGLSFNPVNPSSTVISMGRSMLDAGFAVAASNYGVTGFAVTEGVESTYELTMYIIENFDVTGKVFLYGLSMGGGIALLLGEKYPDVYSGVLDAYGIKDIKALQTYSVGCSLMTDEELEAEFRRWGITQIPPDWFTSLQAARDFFVNAANSTEYALGGTPESNPQAYEDVSPTYHANIQIPVITVHGTDDSLVPYYQSIMYQDAVADAGRSSLHRLHTVPGAGHGWLFPTTEIPNRFGELVEWSNELTGAADWPMFHNDLQNTGYSTSNAPSTNHLLWNYTTIAYVSSPSVVDGKVYVGSYDNKTYCLDAATGAELWSYETGDYIMSSPAVVNGKVYVGSFDDKVYCFDAVTGAVVWSYTTGDNVESCPVVANGKVYVGSHDDKLYCFRADHGQVVWKFTTGGDVRSSPVVVDGKVYFGSFDRKIYCVDAATSELIWSYTTGAEVFSSPAVANGVVYEGSNDGKVYALNALTGALLWSYQFDGVVFPSPAVADGKVYVGNFVGNARGGFYCLDALTGALVWNYTTGGVYSSPAIADGKVYFSSLDGNVYCFDAAKGALMWNYEAAIGALWSSPTVANGVVYIGGDQVRAFGAWEPIPEGLTIGVMLLLSTIAVAVSARYFRKRREWENW